jgi:hypothetical protein
MTGPRCRFCDTALRHTFVDLGMSPLCETFLTAEQLDHVEHFHPLHVQVCHECYLVQLQQYVAPEHIFTEYAYFSSYSTAWLKHAEDYTTAIVERLGLGPASFVVELASNDGYLLRNFVARGIPCLGIEPAVNVARAAVEKGVDTLVRFFDEATAHEIAQAGRRADLIIGNNVLAQVPDINSFVAGVAVLLKPTGVVTMEFPHLERLIEGNQFDTIYHEHFSYFSLLTTERIFAAHGLVVFDVEELWTHGGSLRVHARHADHRALPVTGRLEALRAREVRAGFGRIDKYLDFEERVRETKRRLLELLIQARRGGARIVGYGAPGKGNTLLNYCGIRTDFLDFTVDRNPYKHGRYTPGTHIPIHEPARLDEARPDLVLILPWNLKDEIITQLAHIREWGGRFIVPIPQAVVVP